MNSLNSFRATLERRLHSSEDGISLVEVMIAMLIFSIVSFGIIGTLIATGNFANDSRARETATNLASQTIDNARSIKDVFDLFDAPNVPVTVDGRTFTVSQVARWVSDANSVAPCGAGGGALLYKRVNVTVTWPGMSGSPVEQDTLIAPTTRVSDPDDATILVSVADQTGAGIAGVTIKTTPALSPPADVTDVDGCTYLLKVPAGSYTITATKTGYVSPTSTTTNPPSQLTTQSQTLTVVAGASIAAPFTMDKGQPLTINYASNRTGNVALPTSMYTSLVHSTDAAIDANAQTQPLSLYPYAPDGYSVYAGHFVPKIVGNNGCQDANPQLWASGKVSGVTYNPPVIQPVIPAAGAVANVPMGLVTVTGTGNSQPISAVQQTGASPDPGCALPTLPTYNFGNILSNGKQTTIALPYGTYTLFYGNNGGGSAVAAGNIIVSVPSTSSSNKVVLDPRAP